MKRSAMALAFILALLVSLMAGATIVHFGTAQRINVSGDFWVERASMPNSQIYLGAVTIEGKIFVIGSNYTVDSNSNCMYDPLTNTWISKAPMNLYRGDFAVATVQSKIYVIGGGIGITPPPQYIPIATAANEMYDPATDTWTNKTSLPTAKVSLQAVTVNGKIYVMGGAAGNETFYTVNGTNEAYDPASDSWQELAPMPTPVGGFAMTAVGSKIYVMGGMSGRINGIQVYSNQTQIYDTQTNTWTFGHSMPITTFSSAAAVTTGTLAPVRVYYIGGTDETIWAHTNTGPCPTQIYDPQTNNWSTGASVPTPRESGFVLAVASDSVYAIGGYNGTSESPVNEQYFPLDYKGSMPLPSPSPTVSILSPENTSYSAIHNPVVSVPLTYWTNASLSWVGYSLDGGSNVTASNGTLVEIPVGSKSLTVYANDSAGNWAAPQTVYYSVLWNGGTLPPEPFPWLLVAAVSVAVAAVVAVAALVYWKKRKP